ncbi:MAG: RtcB family protein [Pseudomonadota bacterium]
MLSNTKIYADGLEDAALDQFNSAMSQPFSVYGALMPDAHTGYSLPIGAVVATKDVVLPAWVGYDIGCGMCALKLDGISRLDIEKNSNIIFDMIYRLIPVGFNVNENNTKYSLDGLTEKAKEIAIRKKYKRALGSLGGGNHFIEIGYDNVDNIWVVIHSGSRGVGHGIAAHYMTLASSDKQAIEEEFDAKSNDVLKYNPENYDRLKARYVAKKVGKLRPKEGHYSFNVDSQNGKDYIKDLNWCLDFALQNRKEMLTRVVNAITSTIGIHDCRFDMDDLINRNHNHAVERDGLWIHRKGATHAEKGMMGVIPGNMKDGSFIVRGKGNPDSLYSSSHGAGRVMSRKKAKDKLNVEEFKEIMEGVTALVGESTLDESPLAYKDIHEVMRLQGDLVDVVTHIKPLINVKG